MNPFSLTLGWANRCSLAPFGQLCSLGPRQVSLTLFVHLPFLPTLGLPFYQTLYLGDFSTSMQSESGHAGSQNSSASQLFVPCISGLRIPLYIFQNKAGRNLICFLSSKVTTTPVPSQDTVLVKFCTSQMVVTFLKTEGLWALGLESITQIILACKSLQQSPVSMMIMVQN